MIKKLSLLSLFVFAIATSACSVAAQNSGGSPLRISEEDSILGTWRLDGELPPNNTGHGFHWFLEYTFNADETFLLTGYPPLMQKGKYRVVKTEDEKLIVDLYDQTGNFGTKDKQIEIVVNTDNHLLTIDGKQGFARQGKIE